MCLGVLVVEAALRSGSLITARLAGEQGRDVFAIPGSPLDPRCRGANDLIRNGATLTECADDVLTELVPARDRRIQHTRHPTKPPALPDPAHTTAMENATTDELRGRITEMLGPAPQPVDALIRDTGQPAAAVWAAILDLELAGRLERQPGNTVALIFE